MSEANRPRTGAVCAALGAFLLGIATTAAAQATSAEFHIAAQPAPQALNQFAAQAHVQLLFNYKALTRFRSQSVDGQMAPTDALTLLLRGTGFTFQRVNRRTFAIVPAAPPAGDARAKHRKRALSPPSPLRPAPADGPITGSSAPLPALQEVVVTAEMKRENIQNTALLIDAVKGSTLSNMGMTNSYSLTRLVPSLTLENGGGSNTALFMNGVGNKTGNSYLDPAIAVSYDGVYMGRAAAAFGTAFFDLARVEVLKGPQGILYGKNATGGAINIIPNPPRLHRMSGGIDASLGDYATRVVQGHINLPIGADAAVRIAGAHQSHRGYNLDGTGDQDTDAGRVQFLYEPTPLLSLRLGADYAHLGGKGAGGSYVGNFTPSKSGGFTFTPSRLPVNEGLNTPAANAYRSTLLAAPGFGFFTPMNSTPRDDYTYWGLDGHLHYRTPHGTLTLIPAYRVTQGATTFTGPAFNMARVDETDRQYSFEGRYLGSASIFDYLGGLYYFHETIRSADEFNQEFVLPMQQYRQLTTSWAAFGQLTTHVTRRLRFVVGGRYTRDKKTFDGTIDNFITFCGGVPPHNLSPPASFAQGCASPTGLPRYPDDYYRQSALNWLITNGWIAPGSTLSNGPVQVFPLLDGVGSIQSAYSSVDTSGTFSKPTWKTSLLYNLAPTSLLYATLETGYRAGGFQLAQSVPRYAPETIRAYTLGWKNELLNHRLVLNADAFLWQYHNQQVTYFTVDPSGVLISATENVGQMSIKGVDLDVISRLTHTTIVNAKLDYLHSVYDNFLRYTAAPRNNINCPYTLTGKKVGGAPEEAFNCAGRPGLYAPRWMADFGLEQQMPIGEAYDLVGSVQTAWRDTEYGAFEYLNFEKIPAYFSTDLSLRLMNLDHGWTVGLYARNLENVRQPTGPQLAPTGQAIVQYGAPLTYGIRVSDRF